jgi:hypothetical protein
MARIMRARGWIYVLLVISIAIALSGPAVTALPDGPDDGDGANSKCPAAVAPHGSVEVRDCAVTATREFTSRV